MKLRQGSPHGGRDILQNNLSVSSKGSWSGETPRSCHSVEEASALEWGVGQKEDISGELEKSEKKILEFSECN